MSTFNHLVDLQRQEQICYVQCGFCTTVLLVCVPFRCLSMVVTVKCGHCTGLLSVNMMTSSFSQHDDDDLEAVNRIVNKPPEKKQRTPSTYNKFMKEEIRRVKTQHPNMSHKQAFITAAKNWAHSPSSQQDEEDNKSKGSGCKPTMMIQELGSNQSS
ncbi:hypothetical protein QVD17_40681 [Tagetes erecta]|uniref:Uncharacterized protein n=1 Tax=Tagetes erecta TaxID=13708 RepID=A0AAD8NHY5_TARER|nr:hypothetical protein QVD17_40681 [Tagetes erecta]